MKVLRRVSVVLLVIVLAAAPVFAQSADSIPNFAAIRDDMELAKGALERTAGMTVLNTYIPNFGVVFIFTVRSNMTIESARTEIERALRFLGPSLEKLADNERIVMIAQREGFTNFWEVMYVTTKAGATDPAFWTVYVSETR